MCGRFSLSLVEKEELRKRFSLTEVPELKPSYNIAPTQKCPIVIGERIVIARWGLERKSLIINARAETIDKLKTFKESFCERRCLVIADGYYEWSNKTPYRITMKDGLFAMAGIWEIINGEKAFSIVTCPPNNLMKRIHERMPVILTDEKAWLRGPDKGLLKPYPGKLEIYEVSSTVNSPKNNNPELIRPKQSGVGLSAYLH